MRSVIAFFLIFCLVFSFSDAFSQLSRKNQFEIYAGAGFPLSPDEFKDYYKIGLSLNAQYVIFPTPRIGIPIFAGYERFTVNTDAINDDFRSELVGFVLVDDFGNYLGEITDANVDATGASSAIKFGAGIRPYLTPPEASTQLFLFANATYNLLKTKEEFNGGSVTVQDAFQNEYVFDLVQDLDFQAEEFTDDRNKFGIGFGAGIEIPAGSSINLIFQGMYNMIFTEKETDEFTGEEFGGTTSFIGVTGGIVF